MTRGFFVGRFQPFHRGHQRVVERIVEEVDELVVGVGSADASHTTDNPFTGGERVLMVSRALAALETPTYVVPIQDVERNAIWVSHVRSIAPDFDVAYSHNPLVIRLFEEAGTEVRRLPMIDRDVLEGTQIRAQMVAGGPSGEGDGGDGDGEDDASGEWESNVPEPVRSVIAEIGGVERLRRVNESDANGD